jgi:biotin carboxyl carrier protein
VEFELLIDDKIHKVTLEKVEDKFVFADGEKTHEVDIGFVSSNMISILLGGRSYKVYFARDKDKKYFDVGGTQFVIREPDEERQELERGEEGGAADKLMVKAPMPGKVIKINVTEDEAVRKNQTLAIVEAMKMENEIKSSIDGYVKKIYSSPGDMVDSENPLIELEVK